MTGTIFEQNRKLKLFKNMHNTCFKGVVYLCVRGVHETTCCPSMQILPIADVTNHRSFLNGVSSSCRWIVYDTASLLWIRVEDKMAGTIFEQNRKLKLFKNMHNTCFKGVVYRVRGVHKTRCCPSMQILSIRLFSREAFLSEQRI